MTSNPITVWTSTALTTSVAGSTVTVRYPAADLGSSFRYRTASPSAGAVVAVAVHLPDGAHRHQWEATFPAAVSNVIGARDQFGNRTAAVASCP